MKQIRIWSENFWAEFLPPRENVFSWLLRHKYDVVLDSVNPEYVFTGSYSGRYPNAKIITFINEPEIPKGFKSSDDNHFILYQYFNYEDPHDIGNNCMRFPSYLFYMHEFIMRGYIDSFDFFKKERKFEKEDMEKKVNFCAFIHGICGGYRGKIAKKISKIYKDVHVVGGNGRWGCDDTYNIPSIGRFANGYENSRVKMEFIKSYKFTFGFEGYTTKDGYEGQTSEKLIEPMVANSLPLYWGNKLIYKEFNTKSFLNIYDYNSEDEFIGRLIEIDNNDDLYMEYMRQRLSIDNKYLDIDYLLSIMDKIIK